jgi:hypothetical protein
MMTSPRAPAVAEKLEAARTALAMLNDDVAQTVLDAAENAPGAPKRLFDIRTKIAAAERDVVELEKAYALAAKLDRQAAATAVTEMRSEQLAALKKEFKARDKAMAVVLKAAAEMAAAYGDYSEATLRAAAAAPTGTVIPQMSLGPDGVYGPAFGPCGALILAELWRLAPERQDGIGRFVLPFAKPSSEMVRHQPTAMPAGIDEMQAADEAIISSIISQIDRLNAAATRAAEMTPDRKEVA